MTNAVDSILLDSNEIDLSRLVKRGGSLRFDRGQLILALPGGKKLTLGEPDPGAPSPICGDPSPDAFAGFDLVVSPDLQLTSVVGRSYHCGLELNLGLPLFEWRRHTRGRSPSRRPKGRSRSPARTRRTTSPGRTAGKATAARTVYRLAPASDGPV